MQEPGQAPERTGRGAAVALLSAVLDEGRALSECAGPLAPLAPAERAYAQRLALAALRNLDRADRTLRPHLRRAPPARVRHALRIATVEMLGEGAPAHAVVNAAVALLRAGRRSAPYAALANAVLRRVAESGAEAWAAAPPERLPKWLRGRLISAWGSDAVAAMEAAHLGGATLDLTAKGDPAPLAAPLDAAILPTGSLRRAAGAQVSELPFFAEGLWWVQDAAAALPARGLALRPGERVLDLCAAPGGKTLQMAAAGARVTALDISEPRLARLAENLARCGLAAEVVAADALDWEPEAPFDAILLDAPCTATGTIRRHPDLPHVREAGAVAVLARLQAALLDRALGWLAPGGRLVYATCSLLPEEGEHQVAAALSRHPGLAVDRPAFSLPGVEPRWTSPEGGLRLRPDHWPERGGMDGFYMACLRRA